MPTIKRRTLLKAGAASLVSLPFGASFASDSTLNQKAIPSTGEMIPVIGIGTNRYGVGYDEAKKAPLREVLREFAKIGNGVIDTAPMYRSSETVLGSLISDIDAKDRFFIATKCDVEGGDDTRAQLASSEQKLQSGQLDLVAVHNLKYWKDQLPVLREAKESGAIRYIGITTSRDPQYEEFEKVLKTEPLDFMQINYSLYDRDAEPLLQLAQDKGVAVMANIPLARGKLFAAVEGQELPEWAASLDIKSWGQFFLKYVVSHPAVTCAIPGTRKLRHLHDNLAAGSGPLATPTQRQAMEQFIDSL